MNPQEYTVRAFKAGDFKDNFGNSWCEAVFEEYGEPVRWVVKDPATINVGKKVYGHISEETSKAGKPYQRFRTDKREEGTSSPQSGYIPKDNRDITLSMVWKTCAEKIGIPQGDNAAEFAGFFETVKAHVDELLLMSEQIKQPQLKTITETASDLFPSEEG